MEQEVAASISISGIIDAEGVEISRNIADDAGAGIASDNSVLNFRNSDFNLNRVGFEPSEDGSSSIFGDGGAVHVIGDEALSLFSDTVFSTNSARNGGGAILNSRGAYMRLTDVTIEGNRAEGLAGGVFNTGRMGIFNSLFTGNRAQGDSSAPVADCSHLKVRFLQRERISRTIFPTEAAPA